MSEAKHTPGPWHIEDTNKRGDLFIAAESDPNALVIALMETPFPPPCGRTSEQVHANARLIAAAPRMYDGLITITNVGSGESQRIALEILREIDGSAVEGQ